MITKQTQSLGGLTTAKIFRDLALKKYYLNPICCKQCFKIIDVDNQKVSVIKRKKFCNQSCAAKYNNFVRSSFKEELKKEKSFVFKFKYLEGKTKLEIYQYHKNWQSARSSIRKHANYIYEKYNKFKVCLNCNYFKFAEICHIKSVSSFDNQSKIEEINNINNLIALCPNCHWEFDNGLLNLDHKML